MTAARQDVLVVGGGYAGLVAAGRIADAAPGARVTLVDPADRFRQRIRMHEWLAGGAPRELPFAALLARRGIRFVQGWAEGIDLRGHRAAVRGAEGGRARELAWDLLVLAAGSRTAAGVPGAAEHAVRVDDRHAASAARELLPGLASRRGRVIIVGGGLTAIETAAELATRHRGLRVAIVTAGTVGDGYAPRAAAHLRRFFEARGVELIEGARVTAVERGAVLLGAGVPLASDLTIWCGGFQASPLGWDAGLAVEGDGRVSVDATLRPAGHPDVLVAGDLAALRLAEGPAGVAAEALRMSCQAALPMGAHAAANAVRLLRGAAPVAHRFGFTLRCVSLGRRDGLNQFTDPDDRPVERVVTGRAAALVKELICRMTYTVVDWETRRGLHLYRWPSPARPARPGPATHDTGLADAA